MWTVACLDSVFIDASHMLYTEKLTNQPTIVSDAILRPNSLYTSRILMPALI